jgi:fructoselysine 6-kinase
VAVPANDESLRMRALRSKERGVGVARIAAVGEVVEDRYLPEDESFAGGISLNFARAVRFAGAEATVFGCIGRDERGERMSLAIERLALPARLQRLEGPTALQWIRVRPDGERQFCGFEAGVIPRYRLSADELDEVCRHDAVALPCADDLAAVFQQLLTRADLPRLVADYSKDAPTGDPAHPASWLTPHLERLSLGFIGADVSALGELRALSKRSDTLLVLTAGADGAFALSGGRVLEQPSLAGRIVDTTGCGDAFQGAFTARWMADGDVRAALRSGAECAARVAARRGAGV